MASWQLITRAGQTLAAIVERRVRAAGFTNVSVNVASASAFKPLASTASPAITFFLYRISELPEMRNAAMQRSSDGRIARQPLPLELSYLVTPWVKRGETAGSDFTATEEEHKLLGLVLQALYDHADVGRGELLDGPSAVWGPLDSMQVVLETLPIEDQYRIWDATDLGYRLSLAYRVRVLGLEPAESTRPPAVTESQVGGEGR